MSSNNKATVDNLVGVESLAPETRRARLRRETLAEIREQGLAQVREAGLDGLSLNGIARGLGMSGPAIYRYYASRDELLAALVAAVYDDLGDTLVAAAHRARRRAAAGRLRVVAEAYRTWALAHPHEYRLAFSSAPGSGTLAPETTIPAAQRGMEVLIAIAAELAPSPGAVPPTLARQLRAWAGEQETPAEVLLLAVLVWTRLHGLVSLELEGTFTQMGLDPALLVELELDRLLAAV